MRSSNVLVGVLLLLVFVGCSSSSPSKPGLDGGGTTDAGVLHDGGVDGGQDAGSDAGSDGGTALPAPKITATSPADGAVGVSTRAPVTATFDLALAPASVNASTFVVDGVAGQVTYDDATRTATFTPTAAYPLQTKLTVRLKTGITSAEGAPLASEVTFSFTTNGVLLPAIVSHAPADGTRLVPVAVLPSVTFNKPMDPASLQAALSIPGVSGSVSYDASSNTATFHPDAPLSASTTYSLEVSTAAQDTVGSALSNGGSFAFTTLPPEAVVSQTTRASLGDVALAYDAAGNGVALWIESNGNRSCMEGSHYSAAQDAWSPTADVDCGVTSFDGLTLIAGPNDQFAFLYKFGTMLPHVGVYSGGSWQGPPVDLGLPDDAVLAANDDGFLLGFGDVTMTLYPFQGGAWGAPLTFSIGTTAGNYIGGKLAIAGDGANFQIAYVASATTIRARVLSGGSLGAETLVATAPADTATVHHRFEVIRLARMGTGVVASWLQTAEDGLTADAAIRTINWSSPTELLTTTATTLEFHVVANGSEALFVAHPGAEANQARLYTGGAWQAAQTIGAAYPHDNYNDNWLEAAGGSAGFAVAWHADPFGAAYVSQLWSGAWQTPVQIVSGFDASARLLPTADGFEVLGWTLTNQDLYELHSTNGVFSAPAHVESSTSPVGSMDGAVKAGVAQAAYVQSNAVRLQPLDNLAEAPSVVANAGPGAVRGLAFARDGSGVGLAAWYQFDGAWNAYGSLQTGGSWSAPFKLGSGGGRGLAVAAGGSGFVVVFSSGSQVLSRTVSATGTLGTQVVVGDDAYGAPAGSIAAAFDGTQWLIACNADLANNLGVDAYVSADPTSWGSPTRLTSLSSASALHAVTDGDGFAVGVDQGDVISVFRAGSWSTAQSVGQTGPDWELTGGPAGYAFVIAQGGYFSDAAGLATWPAGASDWTVIKAQAPFDWALAVTVAPTPTGFTAFGTGVSSSQVTFDGGTWGTPVSSPFGHMSVTSTYVPGASGALMADGQIAKFLPPAASQAQAPASLSASSSQEGVYRANGETFDRIWIGAAPGSAEVKVRAITGF